MKEVISLLLIHLRGCDGSSNAGDCFGALVTLFIRSGLSDSVALLGCCEDVPWTMQDLQLRDCTLEG